MGASATQWTPIYTTSSRILIQKLRQETYSQQFEPPYVSEVPMLAQRDPHTGVKSISHEEALDSANLI